MEPRGGALTSVTAWRFWNWLPANDRDFTGLPITTRSNNPSKQDQYTQEFRYAWANDRVDFVVGLFGFRQELTTAGIQERGPAASRWLLDPTSAGAECHVPVAAFGGGETCVGFDGNYRSRFSSNASRSLDEPYFELLATTPDTTELAPTSRSVKSWRHTQRSRPA
jgi:hypothetical protein